MKGRGVLTDEIKELSERLLGYEITQAELRLMLYLQYVLMNEQKLDIREINSEERKIWQYWKKRGFVDGGASGIEISKIFWDAINQILWLGYVVYD